MNTNRTIEIEGSPAKPIVFLIIGAVMALFSFMLAYPLSDSGADRILKPVFYGAAALFGGFAMMALRSLFKLRGTAVTISPQGLLDTRLAAETIPWGAVRGISTWDYAGIIGWSSEQNVLVLKLDPQLEAKLNLTLLARLLRRPNRWLGADGLCMGAQDLKIEFAALQDTLLAYARAHGGKI
jgi:hypothetical protein